HMVAQQTDLEVGDFIWTGGDCHIYDNHTDQVRTQLEREPYDFPTLQLHRAADLFSYDYHDVQVAGYSHHPGMKAPVAVWAAGDDLGTGPRRGGRPGERPDLAPAEGPRPAPQ